MGQQFSIDPCCQVPTVPRLHLAHMESLHQLSDNGFDAPTHATHLVRPGPLLDGSHALAHGRPEGDALFLEEQGEEATEVTLVTEKMSGDLIESIPGGLAFINVGRGESEGRDDAIEGDDEVSSKAVEVLLFGGAVATCGVAAETTGTTCAGEVGDQDGEAVDHVNEVIQSTEVLGEHALQSPSEPPEVGGLANEGGAVTEAREETVVVLAEVGPDGLVGVVAEKLADDEHRDDFAIGQDRHQASWTETSAVGVNPDKGSEEVVDEALDEGEEVLYGEHGRGSLKMSDTSKCGRARLSGQRGVGVADFCEFLAVSSPARYPHIG